MSKLKTRIQNKRDPWKHFVRKYLKRVEFENHLKKIILKMSKKGKVVENFIFKTFHFTISKTIKGYVVRNNYYNLGGLYEKKITRLSYQII